MIELPTSCPQIRILRDGAVGWLAIDRPEKRNALTSAMWTAIPKAIEALDEDRETRVIVVRGAGLTAFSAGADIAEFAEARQDSGAARTYERGNAEAFTAVRATAKPVVAMIAGPCFGGGLALALACDLRIAGDNAVFSLPPARLGLAYPTDALRDLLAVISAASAKEMLLTARRYDAAEAKGMGLVTRVVPLGRLEEETARLCQEIASGAPLTHLASKRAIDTIAARPGALTEREAAALAAACFDSADYAEGRSAFLEKRAPVFKGL